MSMSTPDTQATPSGGQVQLPAGWSAGPARETSATGPSGQVTQGVQIPLSSVTGATMTVFVPYDTLNQGTAAVQALLDQRISALNVIPGQSA